MLLTDAGAKIIGTTAAVIDLAEDREKFSKFVEEAGLLQPENGTAVEVEEAIRNCEKNWLSSTCSSFICTWWKRNENCLFNRQN